MKELGFWLCCYHYLLFMQHSSVLASSKSEELEIRSLQTEPAKRILTIFPISLCTLQIHTYFPRAPLKTNWREEWRLWSTNLLGHQSTSAMVIIGISHPPTSVSITFWMGTMNPATLKSQYRFDTPAWLPPTSTHSTSDHSLTSFKYHCYLSSFHVWTLAQRIIQERHCHTWLNKDLS